MGARTALLIAGVLVAVLAACSGDADAEGTPDPTPPSPARPSPTDGAPPPVPDEPTPTPERPAPTPEQPTSTPERPPATTERPTPEEPAPPATTEGPVDDALIVDDDNGRTFTFHLGTQAELNLDHAWAEAVAEGSAIELIRIDYFTDPGFQGWVVEPRQPGTAVIRASCMEAGSCPGGNDTFEVTIEVVER